MQQSFDASYDASYVAQAARPRTEPHLDDIVPVKLQSPPIEHATIPDSLKAKIVDPKSFEQIPIIDMSADDATIIEQLRYACEVVGFMQVVGHGMPTTLLQKHAEFHRRFFSLPSATKESLRLNDECPVRGYFGRGGEDLDNVLGKEVDAAGKEKIAQQTRKDHKEALDMNGVPWSKPDGGSVAKIFGMPSRLPEDELEGFKEVVEEYNAEMFKMSRRLLSFMAQVLGQDADLFEPHLTNPVATQRLLHYWPTENFNTQIGVGEHTDYGLLTILKQDSVGGLQVLNAKDSTWVHATPVAGAFVVNLGDMLQRWTGNRFKSTVHRVVNTSNTDRYSVPFFLEPNMDSMIVPGGLCSAPDLDDCDELQRMERLCNWQSQMRAMGPAKSAEDILDSFYRASGQLKSHKV
jgi:isopenicillin N synthase-like dioxygenase